MLRESFEEEEKKVKRYEYNEMMHSTNKKADDKMSIQSNKKLVDFEKKFQNTKKSTPVNEIEDENSQSSILSEEEILKNNLGL